MLLHRLPPEGLIVKTKISAADGVRNEIPLVYRDGHWWPLEIFPEPVEEEPTHWRFYQNARSRIK